MKVKLQGSAITFAESDVMIGDGQMALLADISERIVIEPGHYAQIPTPITFAGDGRVIALIDMHAGRLAHALDTFDGNMPLHGQYFIPPRGRSDTVVVDVVNETEATILIGPGMQIGILTLQNIAIDDKRTQDQSKNASLSEKIAPPALYCPKFIEVDANPNAASDSFKKLGLRADTKNATHLEPGESALIGTGFYPDVPLGFEGRISVGADLPPSTSVFLSQRLPEDDVTIIVQNQSKAPITIPPGSEIAKYGYSAIFPVTLKSQAQDPNN